MAIYKNANLDISVSAEQNPSYNAKPSVQFSTQDKNTAKYTFTVKQNNKPVDLTGVTASVTLYSEDKSVFQSDATITSAAEGKIEYVIPSEAIRHHGKTRGDLRLTYPNGDVLGGLRFSFNIEQALIDRAAGVIGGVYIRDFEQLKAEIEETAKSIKDIDVARVDMELKEKATKQEVQQVTAQLADTAKQRDLNIERERINNLLALPPSIDNAETADVRVSTDGKTYSSAGEAVRNQIKNVGRQLDSIVSKTVNLFNPDTVMVGYQLSPSNGELIENNLRVTTEFIFCEQATFSLSPEFLSIYEYDKDKKFIKYTANPNASIKVSNNTVYIRTHFEKTVINNNLMINYGNTLLPYVAYKKAELQDIELKNNVVGIKNVSFLNTSANLFNKETIHIKKSVDGNTGELVDHNDYISSDFIEVESNTIYTTKNQANGGFTFLCQYDKDGKFISKTYDVQSAGSFRTSTNCKKIRLGVLSQVVYLDEIMVVKGDTYPTSYIPYSIDINKTVITKSDSLNANINIFDKSKIVNNSFVDANGNLVANNDYHRSDYIRVKPNKSYWFTTLKESGHGFLTVAFFDINKKFISRINVEYPTVTSVLQTPKTCAYIVASGLAGSFDPDRAMIIERAKKVKFYVGYMQKYEEDLTEYKKEFPKVTLPEVFFKLPSDVTVPNNINGMKSSQFYALWDELAAQYPDRFTKTELAQIKDGTKIYQYEYKNEPMPDVLNIRERKQKKAILVSSVHGEYVGAYNLYRSMKYILENWTQNPILTALATDVHYIIVPVANPYCIDNSTRVNENNVNISRNFESGWEFIADNGEPWSSNHSGAAPNSEVTTQVLSDLMQRHNDAFLFLSHHNYYVGDMDYTGWVIANDNRMLARADTLNRTMRNVWSNYTPQKGSYFMRTNIFSPATECNQAASHKIPASILEICRGFLGKTENHDNALTISRGMELFINWLYLNYKNIA